MPDRSPQPTPPSPIPSATVTGRPPFQAAVSVAGPKPTLRLCPITASSRRGSPFLRSDLRPFGRPMLRSNQSGRRSTRKKFDRPSLPFMKRSRRVSADFGIATPPPRTAVDGIRDLEPLESGFLYLSGETGKKAGLGLSFRPCPRACAHRQRCSRP